MKGYEANSLFKEYKLQTTKKIATLIEGNVSLTLTGSSGSGKSKYLRFLANSNEIQKQFFANTQLIYIDLNRVYKKSIPHFIKILSTTLEVVNPDNMLDKIEDYVINTTKEKVVFIIDHAELFEDFDSTLTRMLRALRDSFKKRLFFVLAFEEGYCLNKKHKHLKEITHTEIKIDKLTKQETIDVIEKVFNLHLTKQELDAIFKYTDGWPKKIKNFADTYKIHKTVEEAIRNAEETIAENNTEALKYLTKNEFLVYKKLAESKPKIISRDDIAKLISPESKGIGVSNEAIDQLISRLRKSLESKTPEVKVKTKRGVGYYLN